MADPRFFAKAGPFTLSELGARCGAELGQGADGSKILSDVAPLDQAGPEDLSFLDNKKYIAAFQGSRAGACLVRADMVGKAPAGMALLVAADPYRAYAALAQAFYPSPPPEPGVASGAVVDKEAAVDPSARIESGAVVGPGASIGPRVLIGANAVVGPGVAIGADSRIGALTSLYFCLIGERVQIHPGVRIGQDGFGFAMSPAGHLKVPQLGRVLIGNDVEIGANSTIDRGAGPDTVIGDGCKIDNLVHIGHNVQLGRGCVIVAQVGISGSTRFGDFVVAAGQAGFTGHLTIGSGAQIAAQSGVMRDLPPGAKVGGSPSAPVQEWLRHGVVLGQLVRKKGRE